jgi:hypothetical protein
MRHHAGGFVDHEEIVVFVQDREIDVFGRRNQRFAGLHVVFERIAVLERMARLHGNTVDTNVAAFDGVRDERARRAGQARDDNVSAPSGLVRPDDVRRQGSKAVAESRRR